MEEKQKNEVEWPMDRDPYECAFDFLDKHSVEMYDISDLKYHFFKEKPEILISVYTNHQSKSSDDQDEPEVSSPTFNQFMYSFKTGGTPKKPFKLSMKPFKGSNFLLKRHKTQETEAKSSELEPKKPESLDFGLKRELQGDENIEMSLSSSHSSEPDSFSSILPKSLPSPSLSLKEIRI